MLHLDSLGKLAHATSHHRLPLGRRACWLALLLPLVLLMPLQAAELKEAKVTQVIKDVKLLPGQAAPRPAAVSDEVRNGTAVRTGVESRAELTFTDQTLARLGANTIFSFNEGTRNLQLGGGAMLLRVPKNSGGAKINTAAVTAAITGTTILLEYHPDAYIKFIVLEGTGRIFRNDRVGESVLLHAGQMLIVNPKGKGLPDPVDVDVKKLVHTSLLINGFPPLASNDLIAQEINVQSKQKSEGQLVETNLVIFGRGTVVSLLDPTHASVLDQANANEVREGESPTPTATPMPTATVTPTPSPSVTPTPSATVTPTPTATVTPTPTVTVTPSPTATVTPTPSASVTPTPGKFGTPATITSPNPYVINSSTVINTDPTITTDAQTDFGKLYRDFEEDGSLSIWLFGSSSSFDSAIGFDSLGSSSIVPIAAFKFSRLTLTGDPMIEIADSGATSLALVSVGDITSGAPGGALTFSGLEFLLLATQNGSITLGSDISFENIPSLYVYARGATSDLTFDSAVSGTTNLSLYAERDIQATDSLIVDQVNDAGLTDGLNITLQAGQGITVGGDLGLTTDVSGVSTGGNISVISGGDMTIGGLFSLGINGSSGHVDNGGSIYVATIGNLTVGSLDFLLNYNNDLVSVTNGANITVTVGGTLESTSGGINMLIYTPIDNTLTNGGNISLTAGGDLSIADGDLNLTTVTTEFTQAGTGANVSLLLGGDLLANSVAAQVQNDDSGQIGTGGNLTFDIGGDLNASDLLMEVSNTSDGNIDNGGNIILAAGGDVAIANSASFLISNSDFGHIGTGGNILVATDGDFTAGSLTATIDNSNGGSIDNGGSITFDIGGALTTNGDADFEILSGGVGELSAGPLEVISGPAINLTAESFNIAGSLFVGVFGNDGDGPTSDVLVTTIGNITVGNALTVFGTVEAGGNISASNDILVEGGSLIADGNITSTNGFVRVNFDSDAMGGDISAGGNISAGTQIGTTFASVTAGGSISAPYISSETLTAGGDITLAEAGGGIAFGLQANTTITPGDLVLNNAQFVEPYSYFEIGGSGVGFSPSDFTLSVASIQTTGPTIPILPADGYDASTPNNDNLPDPGNGGNVTLNISAGGLTIGSEGNLASISANGGQFDLGTTGGNGGNVTINASGDVSLTDGDIIATSGLIPASSSTPAPRGDGGTVAITSSGAIDVNSTILVSSDDPIPSPTPARRSAKGGNVSLTSSKPTGVAINVSNTGQLLALLDAAAPGPGGKITILASGSDSEVDVKGKLQADRGTVDIRHTGNNGEIYLGGSTGDFLDAHADVVKVGALGPNGVLSIGQGSLNADSVLKLYAPGSNGQLNFVANVTLTSGTDAILAANSVTIQNSVVVTIAGNGGPAQVYTNNPNYSEEFGGNGTTSGTFGGNGANNPQPLASAPPFDDPPGQGHH